MTEHGPSRLRMVLRDGHARPAPDELLEVEFGEVPCPFGICRIACTVHGICHLSLADEVGGETALEEIRRAWPDVRISLDHARAAQIVDDVFRCPPADVNRRSLLVAGTPFQIAVWRALLEIPRGRTVSYQELATGIGRPGAARAVGAAVGANRIAVLIPCHRVVRADGGLGGFRWGAARKAALLAWEAHGI